MSGSPEFQIVLVVSAYFLLMIAVGYSVSGKMKSSSDYFKGGGAIPWWAAGLSQYMAGFSSYAFVVVAGVVYSKGIFGLIWTGLSPLAIVLGAFLFGPRWRRAGVKTPVEYLKERFAPSTRQLFSWIGILSRPLGNGMRIAAFGVLITALLGYDQNTPVFLNLTIPMIVVIAGGIVVVLYTMLGGLLGAVVIDVVQFIVLQAALIPLGVLSFLKVGGWTGFSESVPAEFLQIPAAGSNEWLWLFAWFLIFFADYNGGQWGLISRYASTRSESDARKAGILSASMYVPLILLTTIPVLVARALDPNIPSESSFGWISQHILPPGLLALMVAAMFSATLSTISAELNTLAGVFTMDICRSKSDDEGGRLSAVLVGRLATLAMGLVTILIGIAVLYVSETIFAFAQQLASFIVIPVAIPLLMGLIIREGNSKGIIWAIISGVITSMISLKIGEVLDLSYNTRIFLQVALTAGTTSAIFLGISRIRGVSNDEQQRIRGFFIKMAGMSQPTPQVNALSIPIKSLSLSLLTVGTFLLLTLLSPLNREQLWPVLLTSTGLYFVAGAFMFLSIYNSFSKK